MRRKTWIVGEVVTVIFCCTLVIGQQYRVIYNFGAVPHDGGAPAGGVIIDDSGRIFGTTQAGGTNGNGTVFELDSSPQGWTESVIYSFCSGGYPCADGEDPHSSLVMDSAGNLFGTADGGYGKGCRGDGGIVFELSPPPFQGGQWIETTIWSFSHPGGCIPTRELTMDAGGNLYGTTAAGGAYSQGVVFELSPSDGGWSETVLYSFCPTRPICPDGRLPVVGVIFDGDGNLYGTAGGGGINNGGLVFKLAPPVSPGGSWTETVLHAFTQNRPGVNPQAEVIFDDKGNLYGTVSFSGGGVFQLLPDNGKWRERWIQPGGLEAANVVFLHGALYTTTNVGGAYGDGSLFQVRNQQATVLYNFCSQPNCTDGENPLGDIAVSGGGLYGTAARGSEYGGGVIFEFTP